MKLKINKKVQKGLKRHKNLSQYAEHFAEHPESAEHPGYLCNLVIWFRHTLEEAGVWDVPDYFGWDEYRTEDFETWGHNSRWHHTFWGYLGDDLNKALECAIKLADEFGDVDVEKHYFKGGKK